MNRKKGNFILHDHHTLMLPMAQVFLHLLKYSSEQVREFFTSTSPGRRDALETWVVFPTYSPPHVNYAILPRDTPRCVLRFVVCLSIHL